MFGFSALGLDKEGRLNYGESLMTHAMLITAFHKVSTNIKRVHTIMYADSIVRGFLKMCECQSIYWATVVQWFKCWHSTPQALDESPSGDLN